MRLSLIQKVSAIRRNLPRGATLDMSEFKQLSASSKKFLANPTNDDDDFAVESGPSSNTPVRPHSSSFPDSGGNAYSDTLATSKGVGIKRSRRPTINELRERDAIVSSFHHHLEEFTVSICIRDFILSSNCITNIREGNIHTKRTYTHT